MNTLPSKLIKKRLKKSGVTHYSVKKLIQYKNWPALDSLECLYDIFKMPDILIPIEYFRHYVKLKDSSHNTVLLYVNSHQHLLTEQDILEYANFFIASKNPILMYQFLITIKGAPKEKLAKAILKSKDIQVIFVMLTKCELSPELKQQMLEVIINSKNPDYILRTMPVFENDRKTFKRLVDALVNTKDVVNLMRYEQMYPKSRYTKIHPTLISQLINIVKNRDAETLDNIMDDIDDGANNPILVTAKAKIEHPIKYKNLSFYQNNNDILNK